MLAAQKLAMPSDLLLRVWGIEIAALDLHVTSHHVSIHFRDAPTELQSLGGLLFLHREGWILSCHFNKRHLSSPEDPSCLLYLPSFTYLIPVSYGLYFYCIHGINSFIPALCLGTSHHHLLSGLLPQDFKMTLTTCPPNPLSAFHNAIPMTH